MQTDSSLTTLEQVDALTTRTPLPLAENPCAVYLASLAQSSRQTMKEALNVIADMLTDHQANALTLNWGALRFQHCAAIRSRLAELYAPSTSNRMLSALRGVLRAAWKLGQMDAETYHRAIDIDAVRGERLPAGRALSAGEIAALMTVCANDPSAAGARDAAIIALLRVGGLRRAEICELELADFDESAMTLRVMGKGNKERLLPLANGALAALQDWLTVRGREQGALFCPINKGGRVIVRRMNSIAVFTMLQKRGEQANVKNFSPHDFRRTFVSDLLDLGADISTVQRLAGHANPATTARYDRRGEQAKRKAVELLHLPYCPPRALPQDAKIRAKSLTKF